MSRLYKKSIHNLRNRPFAIFRQTYSLCSALVRFTFPIDFNQSVLLFLCKKLVDDQHTTINYTGLKDPFSRICKNVLNQRRVVACHVQDRLLIALTILTGKNWCFAQFSIGMAGWLLLIFLIRLHNHSSSIHSIINADV